MSALKAAIGGVFAPVTELYIVRTTSEQNQYPGGFQHRHLGTL